jgi:acetyltransferase-like isoleucine patch superfamily enzyme
MPEKVLSRILKKLGKGDYVIDSHISKSDLFTIILSKIMESLRGLRIKYFLGSSKGMIFLGRRCKIRYKSHLHLGKTITIGDNVEINALSEEGITIGNNVSIHRNTIIECTGVIRNIGVGLVIGNNVGIAQNCFIQVRGKVIIGNDVIIGPGVSVFSENHNFDNPDLPVSVQGETRKGVVINDGVWIGTRAVILDGVTVGMNSIIAAGSIVNKDVPPYSIVGGVPAKVIRNRKSMDN